MRKAKLRKSFVLLLTFLQWGVTCLAQETGTLALREVLTRMEDEFSVEFSYLDTAIDSIQIQLPNHALELQPMLRYLEKQANLEFIQLNEQYISIKVRAYNYKVCGFLVDEESGEPIADVLVYQSTTFTTTNAEGYFEFPTAARPGQLIARHVGYRQRVIPVDSLTGNCPQIALTPAIKTLQEVTINKYLTRGIQKKEFGETEVDVQHTNILPGLTEPDVFFVLQNLPGIQSIKETVTDINIRGGSNDQNLMLWDGIKLYQTGHFFGLISAINPHIIGQTTLIKNGTSAALGEGVSGTILVETREKERDEITLEAGTNLLNSDLLVEIPTEKFHLLLASRQSIGSSFNTPTYTQYFDRAFRFSDVINDPSSQVINSDEKFSFYDLSLNATYTPTRKAKLRGGLLVLDNGIEYRESVVISSHVESKVSNLDQGSRAGYLSYQQRWSNRFKTTLYASVMNYKQESVNFDVLNGQEHILNNEVLETKLSGEAQYYINDTWDLMGGLQEVETGIRNYRSINLPGFRSLSKEVIRTLSLFTEAHGHFGETTNLALGLRGSYFGKLHRFRIEPRLALTSRLKGPFSVEALAETKSQTTVQVVDYQTDFLGVENRKWELVNGQNIPLLTSSQVSLGLNYQKPALLISMEGFVKEVSGVVTASQGFLNQFEFERTSGSYLSHGFEVLINPSMDSLDTWITYTFLNSDYIFPGLVPDQFRNNFDITHALSAGLSYQLGNLELSSGINYRSGVPFTPPLGITPTQPSTIEFAAPNTANLDPYFRVDFSAKYEVRFGRKLKGSGGLVIWNLTNRQNIINTFPTISENGELSQVNQMALGITPNLNFRLTYTP